MLRAFFITLAFHFLLLPGVIHGFSDLRGKSCMSPSLSSLIPAERSVWSGTIYLTLKCNPDYDFPLNAPLQGTFVCVPDGSEWKPSYIPDCNPIRRPLNISIRMEIYIGKECSSLGTANIINEGFTLEFSSGKSVSVADKCMKSKVFHNCKFSAASSPCLDSDMSLYVDLTTALTKNLVQWWLSNDSIDIPTLFLGRLNVSDASVNYTFFFSGCGQETRMVVDPALGPVCRGCSLGHFMSPRGRCLPCPPGFFSDSPFSRSCKICPSLALETNSTVWSSINRTQPKMTFTISKCPKLYDVIASISNFSRLGTDLADEKSDSIVTRSEVFYCFVLTCILGCIYKN